MPMKHTVEQGECLNTIAARYGFADPRVLYDDPANADLKKLRPNPNVLLPGDVVTIPDRGSKTLSLATGKRHEIVIKRPKVVVRIEVHLDQPHFYHLVLGEDTFDGKAEANTPIEQPVSPAARTGRIELWPATPSSNETEKQGLFAWDLLLGSLDPADEISGVQGRLANLGYYTGPIDGVDNPELAHAIVRFETDHALEVTGDAANATLQAKLRDRHDGA